MGMLQWVHRRRIQAWDITQYQLGELRRRTRGLIRRAMPKLWDIRVKVMDMEELGAREDTTITRRTTTTCTVRTVITTSEVTAQATVTTGDRIRLVWVTF
uniref:(northern house mosquito) hypothetical protein n=1 Tax=Culex pipiens TaxID=7175 RepID=A0A8D8B1H9_CULPI